MKGVSMWVVTCQQRGTYSQYAHAFNKREEAEKLYDLFAADGLPCTLCMAIEQSNGFETDELHPLETMGRERFDKEMNKMADYYQWSRDTHSLVTTPKLMG